MSVRVLLLLLASIPAIARADGPVVAWGNEFFGFLVPPDAVNGVSGIAGAVSRATV